MRKKNAINIMSTSALFSISTGTHIQFMTYICLFTFSSSGTILITRHNTEHSVSSFIRPQHGNSAEFLVVLCLGRDRRPLERGFVEVGGLTANALSCFSRLNRLNRLCTLCRRDCTMKYNAIVEEKVKR